jgi:hypothetical protein
MTEVVEEGLTCILHFTNSTGVSTKLVKAPDIAPVSHNADNGSGFSLEYKADLKSPSRATLSQKNRDEVSRAAPKRGAEIPRYKERGPSERMACVKASRGPV